MSVRTLGNKIRGVGLALTYFNGCALLLPCVYPEFWTARYEGWHLNGFLAGIGAIGLGMGLAAFSSLP